jgi:uncharacterized membrane protein YwzB
MLPILAMISGEKILDALVELVMWAIILGVAWWGFRAAELKDPYATPIKILLILLTVVALINVLLGLRGHAFIQW